MNFNMFQLISISFPFISKYCNSKGFLRITKRLLITYLIFFIAFTGVGLGFLFNPFSTKEASAAWFNDDWQYRKTLTFTHNASVGTPSKVKFDIDTTDAPDKFQADCGDVRFTSPNGDILPYYYDSGNGACDTASTDFYVLLPSIINGSNYIYMYYGNPIVSDGTKTVQFSEATTTPSGGAAATGSEEKGIAPAAYWKMDEGQGTAIYDSTSNNNTGTMASQDWISEDRCLSGKCVYSDGTGGDRLTISDSPSIRPSTITISGWIRLNSESGNSRIIDRINEAYVLNLETSVGSLRTLRWRITDSGGSSHDVESNSGIPMNEWVFVAGTYDGSIQKLYIDGVLQSATTSWSDTIKNSTGNTTIGSDVTYNNTATGFFDEFKIYGQALTAAQIKANYNARANPEGIAASLGANTQNMPGALSDGLVGYWKMDEAGDATRADSSGNGNTLTESASDTIAQALSKFTYGGDFELGDTEYITAADSASLSVTGSLTLSAWIDPETVSAGSYNILAKWDGANESYRLFQNGDEIRMEIDSAGNYQETTSSNLAAGTFYHVVGVYDAAKATVKIYINGVEAASTTTGTIPASIGDDAGVFQIGAEDTSTSPTGYYDGIIDEARIYKRAFSETEVYQLYKWVPGPVGYWKFDEKTGQTVADVSGNSSNGTLGADGSVATDDPVWANGKYGGSLNFDGSNDFVNISDPASGILDITGQISISAWIKYTSGTYRAIVSKGAGSCSTNCPFDFYVSNTGNLTLVRSGAVVWYGVNSTTTVPAGQWVHVAATADGQFIRTYINGIEQPGATIAGSQVSYITPTANASAVRIGLRADSVTKMLGQIDDLRIYNYTRNNSQIIEDMNAGHPAPGSPVGSAVTQWKFDEGYGTTANDSTPNDNDLTLSSATSAWTNSGRFGKAWDGNASRYLSRADDADFDVGAPDDYSVTLWYKSDLAANPAATEYLFNKANATTAGYAIYANTSGNICFGIDDDASWGPDVASCTSTDVYDGTWHHMAAVRSVTADTTSVYIDGRQMDSDNDPTSATLANTLSLFVGDRDGVDNGDEFNGDLDEIKVYRSALGADQVKMDMNRSQSEILGATGDKTGAGYESKSSDNQKYCIPGDSSTCTAPVGEWLFDERTGSTLNDTAGSGNTGTWQGTLGSQWSAKGRGSSAGNFNGTDNYLTVTDAGGLSSTTLSQEAWVYPRANGTWASIINRRTAGNVQGWTMEQNLTTSSLQCQYGVSGTTRTANATTALTVNAWNHVACSYDGSTVRAFVNGKLEGVFNASGAISNPGSTVINIGRNVVDSSLYNGLIDMVRVYGYARSTAQIAYSATDGKPFAHWKFEECQGTTINDASGRSYSGTLNIVAGGEDTVGTCTTSSTAWGDGAAGKRNYSIKLDGTDDYIQVADTSNLRFDSAAHDFSIFGWVKRAANGEMNIISKEDADNDGWRMQFNSSDQVVCSEDATDVTSTTAITDTNWHFVGCAIDRDGNGQVYIDAKPDGAAVAMGTDVMATTAAIRIGTRSYTSANYFNGQIDDLRIYIYPLTQNQIEMIMNEGAFRVGPETGAP